MNRQKLISLVSVEDEQYSMVTELSHTTIFRVRLEYKELCTSTGEQDKEV